MEKMKVFAALVLGFSVAIAASLAMAGETVRVGVLKFGTVNWEIDTILHFELDKANGIELDVLPLAGNEATRIAPTDFSFLLTIVAKGFNKAVLSIILGACK